MQTDVDTLTEIPCFKCLFWQPLKRSHLHCNPGECEKLTEWLLKEAEGSRQSDLHLTVNLDFMEVEKRKH
ncbi:MAG: hypothetical protein QW270_00510 [Candidatus Bathyarchaeia archaeon]